MRVMENDFQSIWQQYVTEGNSPSDLITPDLLIQTLRNSPKFHNFSLKKKEKQI
jgi:hypothetical protein